MRSLKSRSRLSFSRSGRKRREREEGSINPAKFPTEGRGSRYRVIGRREGLEIFRLVGNEIPYVYATLSYTDIPFILFPTLCPPRSDRQRVDPSTFPTSGRSLAT